LPKSDRLDAFVVSKEDTLLTTDWSIWGINAEMQAAMARRVQRGVRDLDDWGPSDHCLDCQEAKAKEWFEEEPTKWNQDMKETVSPKKERKRERTQGCRWWLQTQASYSERDKAKTEWDSFEERKYAQYQICLNVRYQTKGMFVAHFDKVKIDMELAPRRKEPREAFERADAPRGQDQAKIDAHNRMEEQIARMETELRERWAHIHLCHQKELGDYRRMGSSAESGRVGGSSEPGSRHAAGAGEVGYTGMGTGTEGAGKGSLLEEPSWRERGRSDAGECKERASYGQITRQTASMERSIEGESAREGRLPTH
jgi:hypothetical protein